MNFKGKIMALAMCGVAALSFTGCGSQTLKYKDGTTTRQIKVTGGTCVYDSGIIDSFYNGKANGTWIKWNGTQYYSGKTTNAHTTTNMLLWECTGTDMRETSVSKEKTTKTLNGIINYTQTSADSAKITRIYMSGYNYT